MTLLFMLYMCVFVFNQTQIHPADLPASVRMSAVCLFVNVCMFVVASVCRLSPVRQRSVHISQHSQQRTSPLSVHTAVLI